MRTSTPPISAQRRALIAGFGNVLRGDDGFGVEVVRRLLLLPGHPRIRPLELGIGGITLIQELMDAYQAVVIVDAVARGRFPGEVSWTDLQVGDCRKLPLQQRQAMLADIHYANPNRALVLAQALDLLPDAVLLLGCEVDPANEFGTELSQPVEKAVPRAVAELTYWIDDFLGSESGRTVEDQKGISL